MISLRQGLKPQTLIKVSDVELMLQRSFELGRQAGISEGRADKLCKTIDAVLTVNAFCDVCDEQAHNTKENLENAGWYLGCRAQFCPTHND